VSEHDHISNAPPLTELEAALASVNLADWNLRQHPTDADIVLEWWEARRRWMRVLEEAKGT
jgi:hypothetical protein